MKKTLLFLSILPLVGCMSRDLKVSPQVAVPDSFASASEFSGLDAGESAWWASFGDPALPELVRKALANNRSLKAAGASVEIARRQRMGAISDLFPSIALVGQAISQETLIDPDGTTQGEVYGVGATWELDIFGQNRNKARALYQMQYAEAEKQRGARLAVASETARAYLT
ncbi:MAG TPA: TolC family protein, partial [Opitutales bacterium]|nr:TolC family protein [Opitutales bacterium]